MFSSYFAPLWISPCSILYASTQFSLRVFLPECRQTSLCKVEVFFPHWSIHDAVMRYTTSFSLVRVQIIVTVMRNQQQVSVFFVLFAVATFFYLSLWRHTVCAEYWIYRTNTEHAHRGMTGISPEEAMIDGLCQVVSLPHETDTVKMTMIAPVRDSIDSQLQCIATEREGELLNFKVLLLLFIPCHCWILERHCRARIISL